MYSHPKRTPHLEDVSVRTLSKLMGGWVVGEDQLPEDNVVQGAIKFVIRMKVIMDPMSIFVTERTTKENVNITTIMGKLIKCKEK